MRPILIVERPLFKKDKFGGQCTMRHTCNGVLQILDHDKMIACYTLSEYKKAYYK